MRINRRHVLAGLAGLTAATPIIAGAGISRAGQIGNEIPFSLADLRGTANANELGLRPATIDDQSRMLQKILDDAALREPVFLPPGNYFVSNILGSSTFQVDLRMSGRGAASR